MNIIAEWQSKNLRCSVCGSDKSVKYRNKNGLAMCNKCIPTYNEITTFDLYKKKKANFLNLG